MRQRLRELSQTRVRYGYRKITLLLKREGWNVGKELVYRLYREEGLTLHPRLASASQGNRHETRGREGEST